MLSNFDYGVIVFYFIFMIAIGFVFRLLCKNTSDYFRGGGKMQWWMAGSSAFMVAFSAWTFTGAASKAYTDGTIILVIFFGNAFGFLISCLYFAPKFRQMRVVTPMEGVMQRFGRANEQFFTWMQVPLSILYAGIWLNGLGIFLAAVFGFNLETTIIIVGLVVMFMSVTGGSWAVVASDFMQVLILMPVSIVAGIMALNHDKIGGISGFLDKVPARHFDWNAVARTDIIVLWIFAILIQKFISCNNMLDSSRYLCVKDSKQAKKAALLACVLFIFGPILWFIPPMACAVVHPDLQAVFPLLEGKANDAAYVAMAADVMPLGMMGLLVSGIFAATMSSMDSGLNRNAGIFVRNFYHPILRKHADDKELLKAGKITTGVFGALVIMAALNFSRLKGLGLFDLMMQFAGLVALPYSIPLVLGLLFKKAPSWAGWSTVMVGFTISLLVKVGVTPEMLQNVGGWSDALTKREFNDSIFLISVICNVVVAGGWFILAALLCRNRSEAPVQQERVDDFFKKLETPVTADEEEGDTDVFQCLILGRMCLCYGGFICLLMLIPNPIGGRLAFAFCGGLICTIGWLLLRVVKKQKQEMENREELPEGEVARG